MRITEAIQYPKPIFFANRRPGPEIELEDAVVRSFHHILPTDRQPSCIFASKPIGAGSPDLTLVYCSPHVVALADVDKGGTTILAYLRVVKHARFETLVSRLRFRPHLLERCLDFLVSANILQCESQVFSLLPQLRDVLEEVITFEVKVSKWRDGLSQASRNRVFSHRSFLALPESQAHIASQDPMFRRLGIGVTAVTLEGNSKLIRRSRRAQPRVWRYYYELAIESARCLRATRNAI